ncbi:MAG: hypothetical protein R2712_11800 [Vicinamibacterales bacterium]
MAYTQDAALFAEQVTMARDFVGPSSLGGIGAYRLSSAEIVRFVATTRRLGAAGGPVLLRLAHHAAPHRCHACGPRAGGLRHRRLRSDAGARVMSLSALDYAVIGAYLVAITAFGSWFARFQHTTRDYFLTDRSVPWWAICFTIVATETSTLTFIGIPATAYAGNMTFLQLAAGVHHRAAPGQRPVHSRLLPRGAVLPHVSCCSDASAHVSRRSRP